MKRDQKFVLRPGFTRTSGDVDQRGSVTENGIVSDVSFMFTVIAHTDKMPWTRIAGTSDLTPGQALEILRDGEPYAVCNVSGEIRVLAGVCPHAGGPLGQGALHGAWLTCPWHAWEFDCTTGVCAMDDSVSVSTFPVKVEQAKCSPTCPKTTCPKSEAPPRPVPELPSA